MPSASKELYDKYRAKFDTPCYSSGIQWLKDRGFTEDEGYIYEPKDREPTDEEQDVVFYLCEEWDFAYGVGK